MGTPIAVRIRLHQAAEIARSPRLLIPQRIDGIKERGFVREIGPEEDPDESGKSKGEDKGRRQHDSGPAEDRSDRLTDPRMTLKS